MANVKVAALLNATLDVFLLLILMDVISVTVMASATHAQLVDYSLYYG
jgi:hypothetical protein